MSVSFNIAEPEKGPDHHSQRSVYEEVYLKRKGERTEHESKSGEAEDAGLNECELPRLCCTPQ